MFLAFRKSDCFGVGFVANSDLMDQEAAFKSGAISPVATVREAWELIKPRYPLFVGLIFIQFVIWLLASFVPFIGSVLSNIAASCLTCGYFMVVFALIRSEKIQIGMIFEGFSRFVPVVVFMLLQMIPLMIAVSIAIAMGLVSEELAANAGSEMTPEQLQEIVSKIGAPMILMYVLGWLVSMVVKALLYFAVPLVADRNVAARPAIAYSFAAFRKNIGGVVGLMVLQALLGIAGALFFGIGLILVAPVIYSAEALAYVRVFGLSSGIAEAGE